MAYIKEDEYVPGAWNAICDRCGRKRKSTEMRKTWQGYYVCFPEHYEERHPQDFVRAKVEKTAPDWIRPPGEDIYVANSCPVVALVAQTTSVAAGVAVTFAYTATGVLKARAYTLAADVPGTMTPAEVTIAPGATSGTVSITFSAVGTPNARLVAADGCESAGVAMTVTSGGPPPVAGFYGLPTGAVSLSIQNGIDLWGFASTPQDPGTYVESITAQQSFSTAVGAWDAQTFESFATTTTGAVNVSYTDTASGVGVTVTGTNGQLREVTAGTASNGRYSVSYESQTGTVPANGGSKFIDIRGDTGDALTVQFDRKVLGFGMYLIDYLDFGGTATWRFFDGATELFSQQILPVDPLETAPREGSVAFVGIVAQTVGSLFDRIEISYAGALSGDRTGLDNFFLTTPEQALVTQVSVGQTIQFTSTSSGATTFLWNFGDSTTSTAENPTKSYSTPGTYTVTLTVSNGVDSDVETKTGYVVVS